jgi:hypothetical protein
MWILRWRSLPQIMRAAAVAFALHALLLLVDFAFFGSAYAGVRESYPFWSLLRIVVFLLFAVSLLQPPATSKPWLIGLIAFSGYLVTDLIRLREIFPDAAPESTEMLVSSALLVTLVFGIGASWWPGVRSLLRRPAA